MIETARVALTKYGVAVIAFDVLVVRVPTLSVARAVCGCCCCRFSYGWLLNSRSSDAATAAVPLAVASRARGRRVPHSVHASIGSHTHASIVPRW